MKGSRMMMIMRIMVALQKHVYRDLAGTGWGSATRWMPSYRAKMDGHGLKAVGWRKGGRRLTSIPPFTGESNLLLYIGKQNGQPVHSKGTGSSDVPQTWDGWDSPAWAGGQVREQVRWRLVQSVRKSGVFTHTHVWGSDRLPLMNW